MDITDFPTSAPDDYVNRLYHFESNSGRAPDAPGSQYQGLAQLGREERQRYNVTDPNDPVQVRNAVDQIYSRNARQFFDRFGRLPEYPESYLMHNQGVGGLTRMLRNPGAPLVAINPAGNTPWAHGQTAGMTNGDWINGWTNHWNGAPSGPSAPSQPQPRQAMADQDVYGDLLQRLSRPQQASLSDGLWPYLTDNSSGLNRLERAGLWMQSLQNPNALAQLGAANKEAEQRNALMLHLLQAKQSDDYRRAMLGLSTQREAVGEGGTDIYGYKNNARPENLPGGVPLLGPAPAFPATGPNGGTPMPAPSAGSPTGPGGLLSPAPEFKPTSALPFAPEAYGAADLPSTPGGGWGDYQQVAQARPAQKNPSEPDFNYAAAELRRRIAPIVDQNKIDMDTPGPQRDAVINWALGQIGDEGLRHATQEWINGAHDPDKIGGATRGPYDAQTRAARILAGSIAGDKNIELAWKTTQQQAKAWEKENDPTISGSVMQKLNAMDNLNTVLFTGDPNAPQAAQKLPITELFDRFQNNQLNSRKLAYGGIALPSSIPFVGGLGLPPFNTHDFGATGDYVQAFNNRTANYMQDALRLRLAGNSSGTGPERGAEAATSQKPRAFDEILQDVNAGHGTFHQHMQPNEFYNVVDSEMGQNIGDLQNKKREAIQALGGRLDKDGNVVSGPANAYAMAKMIDERMSEITQQWTTWRQNHPNQESVWSGNPLAGAMMNSGREAYGSAPSKPASSPLAILNRIRNGGQ